MGTYTSRAQFMAAQKARFARVNMGLRELTRELAQEARWDLVELTSGSISSATLAALGHPFARSAGGGRRLVSAVKAKALTGRRSIPLLPLNRQTGELHGNIFLRRAGRHTYDVGSDAPHGKYVMSPFGTRKMVWRGLMSGRNVGRRGPMGELEKRHRARKLVHRDAIKNLW